MQQHRGGASRGASRGDSCATWEHNDVARLLLEYKCNCCTPVRGWGGVRVTGAGLGVGVGVGLGVGPVLGVGVGLALGLGWGWGWG